MLVAISRFAAVLSLTFIITVPADIAGLAGWSSTARAQVGRCTPGRDCCITSRTNSRPYRYALTCDGGAQSASGAAMRGGYPTRMFGPVSYPIAAGWMANANIPSWGASAVPNFRYGPAPTPDSKCFLGRSCCAIGQRPGRNVFARAYDGNSGRADSTLVGHGYNVILSLVSPEFCHNWWNQRLAARGLAEPIGQEAPRGAIPFAIGSGVAATPPVQPGGGRAATRLPLAPNGWTRVAVFVGNLSQTRAGLRLSGGAWTNGRVKNGRRDGNSVRSRQSFNLGSGGEVFVKFQVDGGGKYMAFTPRLFSGVGIRHMSTHNSWAGSVVVRDRSWLYGHLVVNRDGGYRLTISRGNYDVNGGSVIANSSGRLQNSVGHVEMQFVDNYAGRAANITIGEARVVRGSTGGLLGAGASCSRPNQCRSGICLLGQCSSQ